MSTAAVHTQSSYLAKNNLHFKPLNVRIYNGCAFAATSLYTYGASELWHGRMVQLFSKTLLGAAYTLCLPLATIEAVVTGALGLISLTVYALAQSDNEVWQKYTLKALSYSLHCFFASTIYTISLVNAIIGALCSCANEEEGLAEHERPFSHLNSAFLDHFLYLGSAALIQYLVGSCMDAIAGRTSEHEEGMTPAALRTLYLLRDDQNALITDVANAIERELGHDTNRLSTLLNDLDLDAFFQRIEQTPFSENLSFSTFFEDENMARLREIILEALADIGLGELVMSGDSALYVINDHTISAEQQKEERDYQHHLEDMVKEAFKELYQTPHLARLFSSTNDEADGKYQLDSTAPTAIIPLANYVQYKELNATNFTCPKKFHSSDLAPYNERPQKLTAAKEVLNTCTSHERAALIQKLIKCADCNLSDPTLGLSAESQVRVQKLFNEIGELAGSLHQGKLMSQSAIDPLRGQMDYQNLFQKAYGQAIDAYADPL